uniref:Uncharacterized protein n=1 Tax=Kalanchoe fedtschenkoi TaxID=63787 RepID=A0A7N0T1Y0_KALFE
MNPNYAKGSGSLNGFDFDLGLGSGKGNRSLNDQKQKNAPSYSSSGYSTMQQPKPAGSSWQYNSKPSWTHQPAPAQSGPGLNGPTSMVGDITGRSWNSGVTSGGGGGIGIVNNNPNLFGDLVGSALGTNKSVGNVPLKNAGLASQGKSAYSMGSMADSLPKTSGVGRAGVSVKQGSADSFGSFSSGYSNVKNASGPSIGGPSLRGMGGANGKSGGMGASKDPFGSLVDFGMKQGGGLNSGSGETNTVDNSFGDFQKAPKGGGISSVGVKASVDDDSFGSFQNAPKPSDASFHSNAFPAGQNDFLGSSKIHSSNLDDFAMPAAQTQSQAYPSGVDPLDMLFSSTSSGSGGGGGAASGNQQPTEVDWGMDSEFNGGHDDGGTTTELEGLPPPPAGVSASTAKSKGLDNYKQGQFADAIKWLSWAVVLLEKSGDNVAEVLSSRASCYKEVGEYKKAVADCTKVLEQDSKNVNVLVQRALLYESIEKYKLGAEDLRAVLKIDPMNRVARSTVHRLTQMAG